MLVHPHNGRIDHLHSRVMSGCDYIHDGLSSETKCNTLPI